MRVGAASIRPVGDVGRCAMTTQDPDTGEPDFDTLRHLAALRAGYTGSERLPCGVYARVVTPGRVHVGDPVEVAPA